MIVGAFSFLLKSRIAEMTKVIVEFLRAHGRFVRGDIAGFAPDVVKKWPAGVCVPYDPDKPKAGGVAVIGNIELNADGVRKMISDAETEFAAKSDALSQREQELADREAELAARERELLSRVAAEQTDASAEPEEAAAVDEEAAKDATKKTAGAPPKQGAKA
ncbi:hypothetical protein [Phaeobacter inhibens]|uniref:hypothetical protein n=1 Tax=Phaeobacter inhibens TaxID=221822 RepID=UPI0012E35ABA|nr:hypothetical protein [Phaeobacter inhibens]WHP68856.1 hypothetical protein QMZ01_01320 [Phaeobacter inhibens]